MDRRTQNAKVLAYLDEHFGASARELMLHCGVNSPRKRISELRQQGHVIVGVWQEYVDEYGDLVRYKVYFHYGDEKAG